MLVCMLVGFVVVVLGDFVMLCVIGWFEIIFWFVFYVFLCVMVLMVVCIEEWYICLVVGLSVLWVELFV